MGNYKKKGILFLVVVWGILISHTTYSSLAFYHYGIEQGLNEPAIIDIEQDSSGFIWLAGNYSLTRFDGENFVEFMHTIQRPLPWNKINEIYIDNKGILWIASDKGFSFYDIKKNDFESAVGGWEKINVNDISENGKGQLLLATDQGLASYDKTTRKIVWITGPKTVFSSNENLKSAINLSHVENDQNNNVWLSIKAGGLLLVNTVDGDLKTFQQMDGFALNKLQVNHHAIKNGKLLLATLHHGLLELDVTNQKITQFKLDVNFIPMHFQIASDSVIWLATDNGLVNLNPHTKEFIRYTNIPIDPYSMTRTAVSHVLVDTNNNLWVSNVFRGIDFGLNNIIFNHMMYSEESSYTVAETEVTSINN
ncbi:MAG TPA: two-component regulator propeller domain-containing protein, partial [Prolixibacteraceae bacterium]|nr:two-component regulator propeller domain-containing protein [Prolixibacteraceae bacterium]